MKVADFGIRGVHLAYEMLDGGYDMTILIDAAPRGEAPGTVYLIEPDLANFDTQQTALPDAHSMDPQLVFATLKSLGGFAAPSVDCRLRAARNRGRHRSQRTR